MKKKCLSLLLYSASFIALIYLGMAALYESSFSFAVDHFYPAGTKSNVNIMEFNNSKFCLKDYALEDLSLSGEALYNKNCVLCHATNHSGRLELLPLHEVVDRLGQDRVVDVVKNGRGEMPVYGFVLSDDEIKIISQYLQQLRQTAH